MFVYIIIICLLAIIILGLNRISNNLEDVIATKPKVPEDIITAWIIYSKGMTPDSGTGENQRPATDKEMQEAEARFDKWLFKN